MLRPMPSNVDLLILGAGWTSTFLIPLLSQRKIPFAATTRKGSDNTIPFTFDPESSDEAPYRRLPTARTVLITFPLLGHGQSKHLVSLYNSTHASSTPTHFIQLGSTGIFIYPGWSSHTSPYDETNTRAIAEDELIQSRAGCVLNLAGLYGGQRNVKHWLPRVAKTKADVKAKMAVHLVHGSDVARAIVATHERWDEAKLGGKRWIVCDCRVYDWWDLILNFAAEYDDDQDVAGEKDESELSEAEKTRLQMGKWVGELMVEEGVRALPREISVFEKKLDSRAFWDAVGIWPKHQRV